MPTLRTLAEMARAAHDNSKAHGWWEGSSVERGEPLVHADTIAAKLALVHSEVSEALEEVRIRDPRVVVVRGDGKPEGFASELADVIIRVFDLAEACGVDIEDAVLTKHAYNLKRPYRHGGSRL